MILKKLQVLDLSQSPEEYEVMASKLCKYKLLKQEQRGGIVYLTISPSN